MARNKREGRTVNRSISFSPEILKVLERRAKRVHGGNLSAAIAESARLLTMQEARSAMAKAHDELYGLLSAEQIAEMDAEERGDARPRRKKSRAA